ncbi:hypothetical protein RhiirC2_802950 [Rhizophagus irregularis]|uniref:Uncharacterized protein n=1 Tax=Rhizophagus irregularis TaxID=588596 RepID=A0A2N1M0U5_9GLOM|nr:hypothetical protein RhiirC2_802950 [Rhizophagus irregularis]
MHLCTCLLLINKGLYLDTNIHPNDLLQQHPSIPVCGITQENVENIETEKSINFQHFFLFRVDSHGSQLPVKSNKAIYAELFGLSKKGIDCALKTNMQNELLLSSTKNGLQKDLSQMLNCLRLRDLNEC